MKKVFILVLFAIASSQVIFSQDVIYGTVRTDGYDKITEGAFWQKRPEAKMIFGGSYPPGYTVYPLDQDYYVRFVDTEHNSLDVNYIVFPKGSVVYKNNETGRYYSAKCGNEIEYLRPVNMVKIVEVKKEQETDPVADPQVVDVNVHVTVDENTEYSNVSNASDYDNYSGYNGRYDYWDDNNYYYRPQYNLAGDLLRYTMWEYLIYRDRHWFRVSYNDYCNWGGRRYYSQCGWRERSYNPPHRRERPQPKPNHDHGNPGGGKPNHDTGGGNPGGGNPNHDTGGGNPGGAGTHSSKAYSSEREGYSAAPSYSERNSYQRSAPTRNYSRQGNNSYGRSRAFGEFQYKGNSSFNGPSQKSSNAFGGSSRRGSSNTNRGRSSAGAAFRR